jgi:hypothetical protein
LDAVSWHYLKSMGQADPERTTPVDNVDPLALASTFLFQPA